MPISITKHSQEPVAQIRVKQEFEQSSASNISPLDLRRRMCSCMKAELFMVWLFQTRCTASISTLHIRSASCENLRTSEGIGLSSAGGLLDLLVSLVEFRDLIACRYLQS